VHAKTSDKAWLSTGPARGGVDPCTSHAKQQVCYAVLVNHGQTPNKPGLGTPGNANPHLADVMRQAEQELRQLVEERAGVTKRIDTVKRTIAGLVKLFGDGILDAALLDFCRSEERFAPARYHLSVPQSAYGSDATDERR